MNGNVSQNTCPGSSSSLPGRSTGRRGAQIPPRDLAGLLSLECRRRAVPALPRHPRHLIEGQALQHTNRDSGFCAAVMCGAREISTHRGRAP